MTALQIILLVCIGIFGVLAIGFMIAFIVELAKGPQEKEDIEEVKEVKSVFEININNVTEEKSESVSEMLAELDKIAETEQTTETVEEEVVEEPVEEPQEEEVIITLDEEPVVEEEKVEEPVVEEVVEEEKVEEVVEEKEEDTDTVVEELANETHEPIIPGSLIDYETRLAKVIANRNKIEKELTKLQKAILKYDRTIRRKDRNQKMLDRRAGELTNLNLLMYSVTDIKNVDEEKKVKQEELTAHIAELKASIQDAEEYLDSNKGKHAHDVSVSKYLTQEKNRYNEEIAELEALIKAINDQTDKAE